MSGHRHLHAAQLGRKVDLLKENKMRSRALRALGTDGQTERRGLRANSPTCCSSHRPSGPVRAANNGQVPAWQPGGGGGGVGGRDTPGWVTAASGPSQVSPSRGWKCGHVTDERGCHQLCVPLHPREPCSLQALPLVQETPGVQRGLSLLPPSPLGECWGRALRCLQGGDWPHLSRPDGSARVSGCAGFPNMQSRLLSHTEDRGQ